MASIGTVLNLPLERAAELLGRAPLVPTETTIPGRVSAPTSFLMYSLTRVAPSAGEAM